jgi:hypothetical protein
MVVIDSLSSVLREWVETIWKIAKEYWLEVLWVTLKG